jgi:predicted CXXCH cytochrome family protein
MSRRIATTLSLALLSLLALALVGAWGWSAKRSLEAPKPRDEFGYAGANACRSCHADHHASWSRTYHRTMTQEASAQSVQGAFDGQVVRYWGQPVRPIQKEGRFLFEYLDPRDNSVRGTVPVARTVGSHRYQQYLALAAGGRYQRLPLIWHNGEQRWIHYNGAFLYDDAQRYDQHAATWNPNCIYCHNTGPEPRITNADELFQRLKRGERFNYLAEAHWDSRVAELGIACETCHGPGAQHAAANRNPVRRYWLQLTRRADPSIVNPRRLTPERAAQVCGQCHGQRLPARPELVARWLGRGPTFRAGEDLQQHVQLVTRDTPVPAGDPDTFRLRFWSDGTPRLSAYELQGLMQSRCYREGGASCIGCHSAHGGDPAGMITAENREGAACIACHQGSEQRVPAHVRHAATGAATHCVDCHMPKLAYGVMEIHRSHRIENPAPATNAAGQRPDACTGCHSDRSAAWAEANLQAWKNGNPPTPAASGAMAENLRQLFAGDPVQRALAARLAGAEDAALSKAARHAQLPLLFAAMEDRYPAVRRFAWLSARVTATVLEDEALQQALAGFDFIADAPLRVAGLAAIRARFHPQAVADLQGGLLQADGRASAEQIDALRAQADTRAINIGE